MNSGNILDSGQVAQLQIVGMLDAAGNPVGALDPASVPAWALGDSSFGALSVDPNLGQIFTPSGKLGAAPISVSIPAVNAQAALAGSGTLNVVPGAAVSLSIAFNVVAAPAAAPAAPAS